MSLLDKVRRCNTRDLTRYRPLFAGDERIGFVTHARADVLARYSKVFDVTAERIAFKAAKPEQRTAAMAEIAPELAGSGQFARLRKEIYAVKTTWSAPEHLRLDRGLVANLGCRAYGVHLNGYVRKADGLHLWIGTRAMDAGVEPGKLDNMVAGGQPAHLGLMDNLVKECSEEASLPEALARQARPVGEITYAFDAPEGLKVDTLFCYDLEVPAAVTPVNRDGEVSSYALHPLRDVLTWIATTDRFKFNVNLVIVDFAIRHGLLDPDREKDMSSLVSGLHDRP